MLVDQLRDVFFNSVLNSPDERQCASNPSTVVQTYFLMQAGDARLTDTRQDEQDRCITIKSTGIVHSVPGLFWLIQMLYSEFSYTAPPPMASKPTVSCALAELLPLTLLKAEWSK